MRTKEELPVIMRADDIAEVLGISKRLAYDIMDAPGFPKIQVRKMKWVSRDAFFNWLEALGDKR